MKSIIIVLAAASVFIGACATTWHMPPGMTQRELSTAKMDCYAYANSQTGLLYGGSPSGIVGRMNFNKLFDLCMESHGLSKEEPETITKE